MRGIACANIQRHAFLLKSRCTQNPSIKTVGVRSLSSSFSDPELSSSPIAAGFNGSSNLSTAPFLGNDEVARLASQPLHPLTLKDLVRFGRPPLSNQALLASARFTREFLPIRLARRIVSLRNLPFIVVSNDHISKIYNNYQHSFQTILSFPPEYPSTLSEEEIFTELLIEVVKAHSNTIPILAKGFIECRKYISPDEVTQFLDTHLRARIGTRLMAEQHIALHAASREDTHHSKKYSDGTEKGSSSSSSESTASYIGTIDTALKPSKVISNCADFVADICEWKYGIRPKLLIDGHTDVAFPYIPVHLEYIITELLKNAFRATVENNAYKEILEPVICTIAGSKATPTISIRIRDRGGGIHPGILDDIWKYSFTTFDITGEQPGYYGSGIEAIRASELDAEGMRSGNIDALNIVSGAGGDVSSIAGLGYGLPLSRAYAEYFNGSLELESCYGWGTDVYLTLKSININA